MDQPNPNYMAINERSTSNASTVVTQQPAPSEPYVPPRLWKHSLCGNCSDAHTCCCSFFCFRCFGCSLAQDMDESVLVPFCVPMWLLVLRTKLRAKENIAGSVIDDCIVVICCPSCALCQLARELKEIKKSQAKVV